jgi:hypothetical protein
MFRKGFIGSGEIVQDQVELHILDYFDHVQ